jgi:iron complex outermembrane receptor protein
LGYQNLKEETSNNGGLGFVAKIGKKFNLTVDAYQIKVKDRIVLTGLFDTGDDKIGPILESMNVGAAQFFTNAVDTKTKGIDVIATYATRSWQRKIKCNSCGKLQPHGSRSCAYYSIACR